jgi:uncharacterized membrane protein
MRFIHARRLFGPALHWTVFQRPVCFAHFGFGHGGDGLWLVIVAVLLLFVVFYLAGNASKGKGGDK